MKVLFFLLTVFCCIDINAQENDSEEELRKAVDTGFHNYVYSMEHNYDSIDKATIYFEQYVTALRQNETMNFAERAFDSWKVLRWLSQIYCYTGSCKEKELLTFIFDYYGKHMPRATESLFYAVEPAFEYYNSRGELPAFEELCLKLTKAVEKSEKYDFFLSICKYFQSIAFIKKNETTQGLALLKKALDLSHKEELNYRGTFIHKYYLLISNSIVQGYTFQGNYKEAIATINKIEENVKDAYTVKSQQYLLLEGTKLELCVKNGLFLEAKNLVVELDSLCKTPNAWDRSFIDNYQSVINNFKVQLKIDNVSSETQSAENEEKYQQIYSELVVGNCANANRLFQNAVLPYERNLNNYNLSEYCDLVANYAEMLTSTHNYQFAISYLTRADSLVTCMSKVDLYASRIFKEKLGMVYYASKNNMLAIKYLNEAKKMYELAGDHSLKYYNCLGELIDVYLDFGDYAYGKLLVDEFSDRVIETLGSDEFSLYRNLLQGIIGGIYARLGYKFEAQKILEKVYSDNSVSHIGNQWDKVRRILGLSYIQDNNLEKGIELFKTTLRIGKDDVEKELALKILVGCCGMQKNKKGISYLKEYNHKKHETIKRVCSSSNKINLENLWEDCKEDLMYMNNYLLKVFEQSPEISQLAYDNALFVKQNLSDESLQEYSWKNIQDSLSEHDVALEFIVTSEKFYERNSLRYGVLLIRKESQSPIYIDLCDTENIDSLFRNIIHTDKDFINNIYSTKNNGIYNLIFKKLEPYLKKNDVIYYSPVGFLCFINFELLGDGKHRLNESYTLHQVSSTAVINDLKKKQFNCNGKFAIYGGVSYDESMDEFVQAANTYKIYEGQTNEMLQKLLENEPNNRGAVVGFLQGSLNEVLYIEDLLKKNAKQVKLFVGSHANEESLKAFSGNPPQVLHISTHGFLLSTTDDQRHHRNLLENIETIGYERETSLLHSGLLLAGAEKAWRGETIPKGLEDGIVSAFELSQLNLKGCDLVVLSACETGLGFVNPFCGEIGLKQALKQAGVGTIVFSLWQIPDDASAMLMQSFYNFIIQGIHPRLALKKAQSNISKVYKQPYFWAGFSIID